MLFVYYPKCSTCMRAKKWLDEKGLEYETRDIRTENPTAEELRTWYEKSGLPLKRFFNTSGNLYKEMKLKTDSRRCRRRSSFSFSNRRNACETPCSCGR